MEQKSLTYEPQVADSTQESLQYQIETTANTIEESLVY
jgi:hypothetical protein